MKLLDKPWGIFSVLFFCKFFFFFFVHQSYEMVYGVVGRVGLRNGKVVMHNREVCGHE